MKSTISFLFLIIEAPCEKKLISTIIIILFHSKIERDTMKFKLNRWRKIDWNRGKKSGPNQSYRQFSSFSRKGWSKNKMKKEGKGGEEKNGEGTKGGRQPARQITEWRFVWAGRFVSACRDFHLAPSSSSPSSSSSSPGQMTRKQGRN